MKKIELITKSVEETQEIGRKIAQKVKDGGLVCLYGELGTGKTSFTQGLAEGLGITRRVNSPTFIIMRSYEIKPFDSAPGKNSKLKTQNFYHLDLYRTSSEKDAEGLGISEILEDPTNIVVIEWAEKIEKLLPKKRTNIYFEYITDEERKIVFHEN